MPIIVLISISYVVGTALGLHFPVARDLVFILAPCALGILLLPILLNTRILPAALAAALCLGWMRPPEPPPADPEIPAKTCARLVEGEVVFSSTTPEGRLKIALDLERCSECIRRSPQVPLHPAASRLYITVLDPKGASFHPGDRLRTLVTVRPIQIHRNPGAPTKTAPFPMFTSVLARGDLLVHVRQAPVGPTRVLDGPRERIASFWNRTLPPKSARLARAMSLGDSTALNASQRDAFRDTGTAHLLAVSGLHLGVIALICYWLLRTLLVRVPPLVARWDINTAASLLTILPVLGFTLLTGARTPVVRACLMICFILLGRLLGRSSDPKPPLFIAAIVLLTIAPEELSSPGFQLSFCAILGFLIAPGLRRASKKIAVETSRVKRLLSRTWSGTKRLFLSCACAGASTAPILAIHFGEISTISIPANMLAIPLAAFLLTPALLAISLLSLLLPGTAAALGRLMSYPLDLFDRGLGLLASLPVTQPTVVPAALVGVMLCSAAIFLLLYGKRRTGLISLAAGALLILSGPSISTQAPRRGLLTVDFLDVGQGDSTLITFPTGERWLVDAGGTAAQEDKIGEAHIVPILKGLGATRIDTLVLTHPDPDHVAGMPAVLTSMEVGRLLENRQGEEEGACDQYASLLSMAREGKIPVLGPDEFCGETTVGPVSVDFLHPCHDAGGYDPGLSFNDNSLVVKLSYEKTKVLLTGDLGFDGERVLLDSEADLFAHVLKLGHHGSAGSTTPAFLDTVRPRFAIASCGLGNTYNMPHQRVVHGLKERGVTLYRTDLHGAVRLKSDGKTISMESFRGREKL